MVTIMEVFEARRAAKGLPRQDSYSAQEFADQGLGMIGGCLSCEATLSADHAYPDRRGYWACEGCLSDGYETVEAFEAAETESVDDDQDDPGDTWFWRRELEPVRKELEQMQDEIGAADERFEKFRQRLAVLSRGKR